MFNRNKIDEDMIRMIHPTSKASLKTTCLLMAKGDIDKADKLYDYFAKDMPDMPAYDAPVPTFMDNVRDNVNGVLSLLGQHKEGLSQGFDIIRSLFGSRVSPIVTDTEEAAEAVESDLPPIS